MICKVCKRRFVANKNDKYLVQEARSITDTIMMTVPVTYEAFDCPKCGCQNIVNVRKPEVNYESISAPGEVAGLHV